MTARLLVAPARLVVGAIVVEGDDYAYLFRARRLAVGDAVIVFDGDGREGEAVVAAVDGARATLAIAGVRAVARGGPRITVVQALVKGERMDWCLEKLVEVGVDVIVPCETERTVVRLEPARRASRLARHRALVAAAARQCGRADLPVVSEVVPLAEALAAIDAAVRIVAHPDAARFAPVAAPSVAILVGPEGGLADAEVALAARHGFAPVSLGPTILRAETAGMILAAAVRLMAP